MIQLLVHAGAPSARKDDEQYRAQAQAYTAFQGRRIVSSPNTDHGASSSIFPHVDCAIMEQPGKAEHATTFLDNTQLAYNAVDSQLATSSLRILDDNDASLESSRGAKNSGTPYIRQHDQETLREDSMVSRDIGGSQPRSAQSQHEMMTPSEPSRAQSHSHSSYLKSPILHRSKKKRRCSDLPSQNIITPKRRRFTYPPKSSHGDLGARDTEKIPVPSIELATEVHVAGSVDLNEADEITSELPTSYSLSDITTDSSRRKGRPSNSQQSWSNPREELENAEAGQGIAVSATTALGQRASDSQKQRKTLDDVPEDVPECANSVAAADEILDDTDAPPSHRGPATPTHKNGTIPKASDRRNIVKKQDDLEELEVTLSTLSKSVQPAEPKAGLNTFTTHVTDSLRYLVGNLNVEKHYKPVSTTRNIAPLERGHWLVDCSPLHLGLQIEFWQFIEKTIKSGNAGWGVWCSRGADYEDHRTTGDTAVRSIGIVKVFCWGEVVTHVYLMLYVASKAKVRKLGLQWIDAEGKVVVQMKKI